MLKQIEIKDLFRIDVLVVEFAERIEHDYYLLHGNDSTYLSFRVDSQYKILRENEKMADGNWDIIGRLDKIKDNHVDNFVKFYPEFSGYKNYNNKNDDKFFTDTALESFYSGLESVLYWENPYGKNKSKIIEGLGTETIDVAFEIACWHDAEQKTFDRNRTLIFKRIYVTK